MFIKVENNSEALFFSVIIRTYKNNEKDKIELFINI
jgi:hypothetical protein